MKIDSKAVRIFAYSSKPEQSNKRSGTRLKKESETGDRPFFSRVRLARRADKGWAVNKADKGWARADKGWAVKRALRSSFNV